MKELVYLPAVSLQLTIQTHIIILGIFLKIYAVGMMLLLLSKSLGLNPQSVEALNNLGICFWKLLITNVRVHHEASCFTSTRIRGAWLNLANALKISKVSEAISSALKAIFKAR